MRTKVYLGDSVFAEFGDETQGMIRVTTENGYGPNNEIFIEPRVLDALIQFAKKINWLSASEPKPEPQPADVPGQPEKATGESSEARFTMPSLSDLAALLKKDPELRKAYAEAVFRTLEKAEAEWSHED